MKGTEGEVRTYGQFTPPLILSPGSALVNVHHLTSELLTVDVSVFLMNCVNRLK